MQTGKMKWFNATKGFGFVQPDQGGSDVFVHISALEAAGIRSLNEGERISFEIAMHKGKASAANVRLVEAGQAAPQQQDKTPDADGNTDEAAA